ncbi:sensor histidine kinase [Brevibacillus ginsengisoli]|uniref:sensor histidine kinase n=1 Tax=Brevibacillus ginsengisoli TaxID=363854 RepID=UPI003CEAB593
MHIKQQLAEAGQFMSNRIRTIFLSFILLYIFVGTMKTASLPDMAAGLLVGVAYLALLWKPGWLREARARTFAVIGIWLLTVLYGVLFDAWSTAVSLVFYLVGYTALRLENNLSVLLTIVIISVDTVIFFLRQEQPNMMIDYLIVSIGIYVLFWGSRMKREATIASKRHYEQLREVHAELEQAHKELQKTHSELEDATVRLLGFAVLEERNRISRDLHDSIGHGLTSVIVQLQALPYIMKTDAAEADVSLKTALEVARRCLQDVRTVVHQMAVDDAGLGLIAVQSLVKQVREQGGLDIALVVNGQVSKWNPEISESMYRILQEALTNVIRHAHASQVEVAVSESEDELTMMVTDDGVWMNGTQISLGFGLSSMKARSERAGGSLWIQQVVPHGMRLIVKMPLRDKDWQTEGGGK